MKYLVLMAADEREWTDATPTERQAIMDAHSTFHDAVTKRAKMLAGEALAEAAEARTLRHVDGAPLVTAGPYAETSEQLGGFYLVEADDPDTVLELCRILPPSYAVEVRPVIRIEGHDDTRDWN
jgi:hypothetical protein